MTDNQKQTLLSRANHDYANAFIEKYKLVSFGLEKDGDEIDLSDALVQFAKEVIEPRSIEKDSGNEHH